MEYDDWVTLQDVGRDLIGSFSTGSKLPSRLWHESVAKMLHTEDK